MNRILAPEIILSNFLIVTIIKTTEDPAAATDIVNH